MNPRILIVDDDKDFREEYVHALRGLGYDPVEAASRLEAQQRLAEASPWDVVLIDEHLKGPGGPASAVEILADVRRLAPEARSLVITAYRDRRKMEEAFDAGAWDYLDKDELLVVRLKAKVRQAVDAGRDLRLRGLSPAAEGVAIRETWAAAMDPATDRAHKGRFLEDALELLFRGMPGFAAVSRNRRNPVEEIDLVVRNESTDPYWMKEGPYILVECKNWSSTVGSAEVTRFRTKLQDRFDRARLGILVAPGGLARDVETTLARASNAPHLVVPLDRSDMEGWLAAPDRVAWLKDRIERAVLRQSGG